MDCCSNIILEWVNCLKFVDSVKSLQQLELAKFIHCFFSKIDDNYTGSEEDVWNYLETFLSTCCRVEQLNLHLDKCRSGDDGSIVLLLSTLLVHHFLECRHSEVTAAMATNLSEPMQVIIKKLLETIFHSDGPVTEMLLKSAFKDATGKPDRGFGCISTPVRTSTPKSSFSSPLVALLQSPIAQQKRELSFKNKEIKRLMAELDVEMQEKVCFEEQVHTAEKEVRSLKSVLHQRDKEIEKLKEDLKTAYEQSPKKKCHVNCREGHFKVLAKQLESEVEGLYKENGRMSCEINALEEKLKDCMNQLKIASDETYEYKIEKESLQLKLSLVSEAHTSCIKECEELREIMASAKLQAKNTSEDESFLYSQLKEGQPSSPENLGHVVVDVMLQEKTEENMALSEKLDSLKAEKSELEMRLEIVKQRLEAEKCEHQAAKDQCNKLEVQVKHLEITSQELISEQLAYKIAVESCKEEVSALTKNIDLLNCELEKSALEKTDLLRKCTCLTEQIACLEKEVEKFEENVNYLTDYVKQRDSLAESQKLKILELLEEQCGYCQQIDLLKISYTEVLTEKQHLQILTDSLTRSSDENLNKWSHHCEELMRRNEELTCNLESLRGQLEKVSLELVKSSEASINAEKHYKTTVDDKDLVISTLTDNKLLLEQSLAESEKERNTLQDGNVKLCEEMGLIKEKLHNMTEKYTTLQNNFNDLELAKCSSEKIMEDIRQARDCLLLDLQNLKKELTVVEKSKLELEDACNNLANKHASELRMCNEKYALLEEEVVNVNLEKSQYADRVASLEVYVSELERKTEGLTKLSEKVNSDLNSKICNLKVELLTKQTELNTYVAELEQSKKQVYSLQECASETVATAKQCCEEVVSATSLQMETILCALEEKLGGFSTKLANLTDSCRKDKVSIVLQAKQLVLHELELKNEKCLKQMAEVKEQYDRACRDNSHLKKSLLDLKAKFNIKEQEVINLKKSTAPNQLLIEKAIRTEFEAKLEKAKLQMEKLMNEQAEKMKRSQLNERKALQDQILELQSRYVKEKKTAELYRNRCDMLKQSQEARKRSASSFTSHSSSTTAQDDTSFREKSKARREHLGVIQESFTYSRSRRSTVPSEASPVFPMEDEEGELYSKTLDDSDEVFSKANLEALKAGRCELPDRHRLSELQYRNSLCPPHLKSSYPAETQFSAPIDFKDEDLKMGSAVDIDQSMRLLQSGERHRRKEKGQGCGYTTPRSVLREHNDSRRGNTPSRIKEFFSSAFSLRDENTPMTPRSRRMSFFRKQMKN